MSWRLGWNGMRGVAKGGKAAGLTAAFHLARAGNVASAQRSRLNPVQRTPDGLFRLLDAEFHFTVDAAASDVNHKCERYFTLDQDGLGRSWQGEHVWLNPPFGGGRAMYQWLRKSYEESRGTALVVVLTPSATDTDWWHEFVLEADELRFIRGRVSFNRENGERGSNAFFPVSLSVFRPHGDFRQSSLL